MTFQLRDYQSEAVEAVFAELGNVLSTLLVAPVGAGKTIMQAAIIQKAINLDPRSRFVCVVHTRELVSQNMQAMMREWPGAPVGLNSASLGRRDTHSQILFCSIQSVYKKAASIGWTDCLSVDECHLISRNGSTMYQRLIADLRKINPNMRVIGMSGTPYRLDSGSLVDGDDALFESVAYDIEIKRLIDEGYLTRPISKATATGFDLSDVHVRGGEYVAGELEKAVNVEEVTKGAVAEIIEFGKSRRAWLVFCAGVEHAFAVRDEFRRCGISCETVEGKMGAGDRASILRRYKNGEIKCLTNINVLSTGFDYPGIDLVALMRPTKSASLYVQQCGRGLRLAPGKETALILDFAGNIRTLGPLDMVSTFGKAKGAGAGEAPTKECPSCKEIVHLSCRLCPDCDYEFPKIEQEEKPRHAAKADGNVGILSGEKVAPQQIPVVDWRLDRYEKLGMPDSIKVTFIAGISEYREWIAFEHGMTARQKAMQWWSTHGGSAPYPKTTEEALIRTDELTMPVTISVEPNKKNRKHIDIVGRSFPARAKLEAAE